MCMLVCVLACTGVQVCMVCGQPVHMFPKSRIFHTHMMYKCMLVMGGRYCIMASPHHSLCIHVLCWAVCECSSLLLSFSNIHTSFNLFYLYDSLHCTLLTWSTVDCTASTCSALILLPAMCLCSTSCCTYMYFTL